MAHTKAIGSTQLGRDSQPKYLGVKLHDGQVAKIGNIIIRQRGTKFAPGKGVRLGSDYTIYSVVNGKVKFTTTKKKKFDGSRRLVKVVNVLAN
ncbi:MAG: 50S ribosomal protein L27 [Candidatus Yanofskybacteria bacterium RIFCSPHIGHO2_02_FULL_44_12b]|uniref:Large ribosomal subunit protein bL27 n=2 Tax=Candidatus Yanofskyibacteriota TaxID=1752733 RepID=A0A1F8GKH0_9BACT|nr:MAG: 50S ribosomal protein L27 [Candidatus Yanofskybacteria bacterium GW2011_GWA2_44_9]OGN04178.1 MAG: 50S ribosomal protein L27 [Candidatus Yanofskybacteria bacterium RIFCSPHIGHO2_01_FULL_44_24]OGN14772.1 MAG: 50S ribosomal protein L27 [Candidatus Yanofskybacteria bacterium RIFCSPHIGHO2_02_FULL_44_12b]OGN25904.1 MAG: 50S ribosomal protein L27 [Candidatus Yanofskybacteria bacterium RIFCSPLOWO2_01_FULL_44_22]